MSITIHPMEVITGKHVNSNNSKTIDIDSAPIATTIKGSEKIPIGNGSGKMQSILIQQISDKISEDCINKYSDFNNDFNFDFD